MDKNKMYELIAELKGRCKESTNKAVKLLNIDLIDRLLHRVDSFAQDCEVCKSYNMELIKIVEEILGNLEAMDRNCVNGYKRRINEITSHLQKSHKLVTEGYYMSTYMPLGMSLGVVFGLTVFDNLALGLPISVALGISIGVAKDSEARKKGLVI